MLNNPLVPVVLPTRVVMSRNGVLKIAPFFTIRMRPACSTTNNLLLPSCADARCVGCWNPAIGLLKEMAGQVSPLADALTQLSATSTAADFFWEANRRALPRNQKDLATFLAGLGCSCPMRGFRINRITNVPILLNCVVYFQINFDLHLLARAKPEGLRKGKSLSSPRRSNAGGSNGSSLGFCANWNWKQKHETRRLGKVNAKYWEIVAD